MTLSVKSNNLFKGGKPNTLSRTVKHMSQGHRQVNLVENCWLSGSSCICNITHHSGHVTQFLISLRLSVLPPSAQCNRLRGNSLLNGDVTSLEMTNVIISATLGCFKRGNYCKVFIPGPTGSVVCFRASVCQTFWLLGQRPLSFQLQG